MRENAADTKVVEEEGECLPGASILLLPKKKTIVKQVVALQFMKDHIRATFTLQTMEDPMTQHVDMI